MTKVTRRAFLADLGKGMSLAVVVACSADSASSTTAVHASSSAPSGSSASSAPTSEPGAPTSIAQSAPASSETDSTQLYTWARVDLDFVSAYLLVRSGEAVLVDTGVSGSEGAIEATLHELGVGWDSVGHVIITHEHGDHAGSVRSVLELASTATGYAAEPDLSHIAAPRALTPVVDGDEVAGLRIIATPGHTPGHVSVLDPGRILVAGDAVNNEGELTGPNPRFSSDMDTANASVSVLAGFDYEVALFGHGEPVEAGADGEIGALVSRL